MKMDTILIPLENIRTIDLHNLVHNVAHKINVKRSYKYVALPNVSNYYTWKSMKQSNKKNNSKYKDKHGIKNLNYLIYLFLYQIFNIILVTLSKNMKHVQIYPPIQMYDNKIENIVTIIIKSGYSLEFLSFEAMKLL